MPQTISKVKDDFQVLNQLINYSSLFRTALCFWKRKNENYNYFALNWLSSNFFCILFEFKFLTPKDARNTLKSKFLCQPFIILKKVIEFLKIVCSATCAEKSRFRALHDSIWWHILYENTILALEGASRPSS